MPTRDEIVEIALSWKGTAFGHQQSIKGLAADCCGFIEGVAREAGLIEVVDVVKNYRRRENGEFLLEMLEKHLDFVTGEKGKRAPNMTPVLAADIVAFCDADFRMPDIPRHLAIITSIRNDGVTKIVHAGDELRGVIHHRMDLRWLERIHSVWAIRGLAR